MLGGFIIGLITSVYPQQIARVFPVFEQILADFGSTLLFISLTTAALWIAVMYLTSPESDSTLDEFYRRAQPGGIGWKRQRERTGIPAAQDLTQDLLKVVAATLLLFGSMFAIGGFLLLQSGTGFISLSVAAIAGFWLRQLNKHKPISMPKPGLE